MRLRAAGRGLLALLPPLALAALGVVFGRFAADRSAAPWATALALLAAAVLALLGRAAPGRRDALAVVALALAPAIFLGGVVDPLTLAVWSVLLGAATVVAAASMTAGGRLGAGRWLALALAAQAIVHADLLLVAPLAPATLLRTLAVALVAALLIARLERVDPDGARLAALAAFAAGPGWSPWGLAALAAGAALPVAPTLRRAAPFAAAVAAAASAALAGQPKWAAATLGGFAAVAFDRRAGLARPARAAVAAAALVTLVAGGLPWRRAAPFAAALRTLPELADSRVEAFSFAARVRALSAAAPELALDLGGAPLGRLVVDSFLVDGAALPCGTPVGRIELRRGGETLFAGEVRVGEGTTEWAAERADVRARLACATTVAPIAWLPPGARFVARRDRARFELPVPAVGDRLVLERNPELPSTLVWAVVGVTAWR